MAGFRVSASSLIVYESMRNASSMASAQTIAIGELQNQLMAQYQMNLNNPFEVRIDMNPFLEVGSTFSGASGLRQGDVRLVVPTDQGWQVQLASHPSIA